MPFDILDLGLIDYTPAWDMQNRYAAEIARGERSPTLLLLEHPHTYTFGRRGNAANLLWDETECARRGISIHWVDRGGDVTYHGPGQLVGYPLLPLKPLAPESDSRIPDADFVGYVRKLETMLSRALLSLGLVTGQMPGMTGVWVQANLASRCPRCLPQDRDKPAKIAAIGVKVDANGITRHGFALNISPQMEYFEGITPCGLEYPVISLEELLSPCPPMERVKEAVSREFRQMFESPT
jgi:lipoyl(octanoyl) transferase